MDHHENKTEYKQGGLHLQVTKLPLMEIVLTDKEGVTAKPFMKYLHTSGYAPRGL